MRRLILATVATLSLFAAGPLVPDRAEAMTIAPPAGIQAALADRNLAQEVAYVCRRVWRCGPYGCGWRQRCRWVRPGYYAYGWYGRPYWHGRYWRHRYWHRHWR